MRLPKDYCRCCSSECEKFKECARSSIYCGIGVYPFAYLGENCKKKNGYPDFIDQSEYEKIGTNIKTISGTECAGTNISGAKMDWMDTVVM